MTPKEKAIEIVNKYIDLSDECDCLEYSCICFKMYEYKAKQCAIIAVDEILLIRKEIWDDFHWEYFKYWQEVKKEINEL
jgi:hypothetical protein